MMTRDQNSDKEQSNTSHKPRPPWQFRKRSPNLELQHDSIVTPEHVDDTSKHNLHPNNGNWPWHTDPKAANQNQCKASFS